MARRSTPGWAQREETKVSDAVYSWNRVKVDDAENEREKTFSLPSVDLKAGDRVRHSIFGEGVVVSNKKVKTDNEVFSILGFYRSLCTVVTARAFALPAALKP